MSDVFISYAADNRSVVSRLCQHLEYFGLAVYDEMIEPSVWRDGVIRAMRKTEVVVVLWSKSHSEISREICAAAEANDKRLLIGHAAGAIEADEPYLLKYNSFTFDPEFPASLGLIASVIDNQVTGQTQKNSTHLSSEDALDPILHKSASGSWSLARWLDLSSAAASDPPQSIDSANGLSAPERTADDVYEREFRKVRAYPINRSARYVAKTCAEHSELRPAAEAIERAAIGRLELPEFARQHFFDSYRQVLEDYADWQLCLVEEATGYAIAVANCVPIACRLDDLPAEGWDWIVSKAAKRRESHPNALGALTLSVAQSHMSKGVIPTLIGAVRELAAKRGLEGVVAPLRLTGKKHHPFTPIEEYMHWKDESGHVFDPLLRIHVDAGGQIAKPAERSITIKEPTAFWEKWSGRRFERSDRYALKDAIAPVLIDMEHDLGLYVEPGVWLVHRST